MDSFPLSHDGNSFFFFFSLLSPNSLELVIGGISMCSIWERLLAILEVSSHTPVVTGGGGDVGEAAQPWWERLLDLT